MSHRSRFVALLGTLVLVLAGVVVAPATPAQAAVACDVTYRTTFWSEGGAGGGFQADITLVNLGDPVDGWTLGFTLAAGQSFRHGWGARWQGASGALTATAHPWNARLATGQRTTLGFQGRWTDSRAAPGVFSLNGVPCVGDQPENRPPTVTLTSPTSGAIATRPGTLRMAATAADPDGAVTTVQFFVNDALVATDSEAPYEVDVSTGLFGFGATAAWARAFDNGSPPLTADTPRVPFQVVSIPPLSVTAEPRSLSVVEGGAGFFDLTVGAPTSATVQMTVTGAPGVTVSPTAVSFTAEERTRRVTVTAAPDAGGQVATVRATGLAIVSDPVTVTVLDAPTAPVSNPYAGAAVYVDREWAAQARAQAEATPGDLGRQMASVAAQPTAIWLDRIAAVAGLAGHLDAALAQQQSSGAGALVVQLVLYDAPARDCLQRAAPGELTVDEFDQRRYRTEFIDPIVEILSRPRYANLRLVTVVEPYALDSLVLGALPVAPPDCAVAGVGDAYRAAVRYALHRLDPLPNAYAYLDFSFSGNLGYPDTGGPTINAIADVVMGAGGPGAASVTGFVTNVGQFAPLVEPFLPDPELRVGGQQLYTSTFFDWNREFHELPFAQRARAALIARGFPANVGMLVDTGRNGWGGPGRPTAAPDSSLTDVNRYVDAGRVDRRPHRFTRCNQVGAGLGERPRAAPAPGVHAYAWITPPGISDGVSSPTAPADPQRPYLRPRRLCDPEYVSPRGSFEPTNALPRAPHAGRWFPDYFVQLVSNAYPPLPAASGR